MKVVCPVLSVISRDHNDKRNERWSGTCAPTEPFSGPCNGDSNWNKMFLLSSGTDKLLGSNPFGYIDRYMKETRIIRVMDVTCNHLALALKEYVGIYSFCVD